MYRRRGSEVFQGRKRGAQQTGRVPRGSAGGRRFINRREKGIHHKGVFSSENSSASTGKKEVWCIPKSLFSREKEGKYIYTKEPSRCLWGTQYWCIDFGLLKKDLESLVAQCSGTPATVAATPPCSATAFQTQISVRHFPGQGWGGARCDIKIFRGCSATPVLHLQNARKSRKSAATRVARHV